MFLLLFLFWFPSLFLFLLFVGLVVVGVVMAVVCAVVLVAATPSGVSIRPVCGLCSRALALLAPRVPIAYNPVLKLSLRNKEWSEGGSACRPVHVLHTVLMSCL